MYILVYHSLLISCESRQVTVTELTFFHYLLCNNNECCCDENVFTRCNFNVTSSCRNREEGEAIGELTPITFQPKLQKRGWLRGPDLTTAQLPTLIVRSVIIEIGVFNDANCTISLISPFKMWVSDGKNIIRQTDEIFRNNSSSNFKLNYKGATFVGPTKLVPIKV